MEHRGREGIQRLQEFDGVQGVMERLYTSGDKGLSGSRADVEHRRETFGSNVIPPKPPKTFIQLVCEAVQDITLIILIVAAVVSLVLSFYKPEEEEGGKYDPMSSLSVRLISFLFQMLLSKKTSITDGLKAWQF